MLSSTARGGISDGEVECGRRGLTEAARIRANHRDLEHCELENSLNTEVHVLPLAVIIAELNAVQVGHLRTLRNGGVN